MKTRIFNEKRAFCPHFRPLDIVILVFCAAACAFSFARAWSMTRGEASLSVRAGGKTWVYPLNVNRTLKFDGPLGKTSVLIKDGSASVIDSPCRDKLCANHAPLSRPGDWTACLPNAVMLGIEGNAENAATASNGGAGDENPIKAKVDAGSW